jgi:hypothetical protein
MMADIPSNLLPLLQKYSDDVIQGLDVKSEEFKNFLVFLRDSINDINTSVNQRDGGSWANGEFNTGMQYYPNPADPTATPRTIFRCVVPFGALPNNAPKSVNHNINPGTGTTANYFFVGHSAWANKTTVAFAYYPIPQNDGVNITTLTVSQTQVTITTNFDATAFSTDVTLYYIVN